MKRSLNKIAGFGGGYHRRVGRECVLVVVSTNALACWSGFGFTNAFEVVTFRVPY